MNWLLILGLLTAERTPDVDLVWGQKIPVRDGVRLNATLFKPPGNPGPLPVIFTLTPYISDTYQPRATYFARHGYVFALVDVRGRGNSEGHFVPFQNEASDGFDVIEWLARQPFCNGKVAMWGGSYAGFDQWATVKEKPPHLATIVPAAAAAAAVDFPFLGGITQPYLVQWATYTSGVTPNLNLFLDQAFWISKFSSLFRTHGRFRDFDRLAGNPSEWFQLALKHPTKDAYWKAMNPTPEQYAAISVPILTITGHYDDDQVGALHHYRSHMRYGNPEAKMRHFLLVGPWDHAGTRTPKRDVGGLTFSEKSLLDLNDLHRQWYDWTMKDGPKPEFLKKRVVYYVVGPEEWKYADTLEEATRETKALYLSSSGGAQDVFHSGELSPDRPAGVAPDAYVYDPLDTRPGELEREEIPNDITDERRALNLFGAGVVYHSAPLAEETELTGSPHLKVFLSIDTPDTDFEVDLYEIHPDGGSVRLSSDLKRARFRETTEKEVFLKPGEVLPYDFDFTFFSRRLAKGSRLRLVLRAPNTIFLEKNYNSGGDVADETEAVARTAHVRVYHDREHASVLTLPIGR